MTTYDDADYINYDPFMGDESELSCVTIKLKKARKRHACFLSNKDTAVPHHIEIGERYRYEKALIDNSFFSEYRICFNCVKKELDDIYGEDEEEGTDE